MERFREALAYRVTFVVAPLGFGKTVAVRQLAETSGNVAWHDLAQEGHEVVDRLPSMDLCVLDGVHLLRADKIAGLISTIEQNVETQWILIGRSSDDWPVGRWIDSGLCHFPVGASDLRFTDEEAFDMLQDACRGRNPITSRSVHRLLLLAEGWPIALGFAAIALRSGFHDPLTATRNVTEQLLRTEVLAKLDAPEWELLFLSACIGYLRQDWVETPREGGLFSDEIVRSLRAHVPWFEAEEGRRRLPKVLRSMVNRRALTDFETYRQALSKAGCINEESGRIFAAMRSYLMAGDLESVERIARRDGLTVAFGLDVSVLETALANGAPSVQGPIVRVIRGIYETRSLHYQEAVRAFEGALNDSAPEDRGLIGTAYAHALVLMSRPGEALRILDACPPGDSQAFQLLHYAAKAIAEMLVGDMAAAKDSYARGKVLLPRSARSASLCWSLMCLAEVGAYLGEVDESDRCSAWALQLARGSGLRAFEARSLYYRYPRSHDALEDHSLAGDIMESARALAADAHDRWMEVRVIRALIEVSVRRGADDEIAYFERELRKFAPPVPDDTDWVSMRSHSMRAAWTGCFRDAAELARGAYECLATPDWRVLRMSEFALYSSQVDPMQAIECINTILGELGKVSRASRRAYALAVTGAALAIVGKPYVDHFLRAEREAATAGSQRAKTFVRAFLEFAHAMRRQAPLAQVHHEALIDSGFGGWSRVFMQLKPCATSLVKLTPTQMKVLARIRGGLKSTAIAAELNMAPGTVKKHVDRICARLGAEGRREAVVIANGYGLFDD